MVTKSIQRPVFPHFLWPPSNAALCASETLLGGIIDPVTLMDIPPYSPHKTFISQRFLSIGVWCPITDNISAPSFHQERHRNVIFPRLFLSCETMFNITGGVGILYGWPCVSSTSWNRGQNSAILSLWAIHVCTWTHHNRQTIATLLSGHTIP